MDVGTTQFSAGKLWVLSCTIQLNIVAGQAHMQAVITPPNGSGLPEQDNHVRHTAETAKEPLEEHDKEAEGWPVL